MELLAQGRDCDVYDRGDGTVLRRSRSAYDQTFEADVLTWAAGHDYPVPAVHELQDDGKDLVMEKVQGPTLLQAIERRPWKVGAYGRLLGDLHVRLHELPAPGFVPALADGDRMLHFDLHPLNVILSPTGPVVIDWTNACKGRAGVDIARAWALMACASADDISPAVKLALGPIRRRLVGSFLDVAGREEGRRGLALAYELTSLDPNISEVEMARMRALVEAEAA